MRIENSLLLAKAQGLTLIQENLIIVRVLPRHMLSLQLDVYS